MGATCNMPLLMELISISDCGYYKHVAPTALFGLRFIGFVSIKRIRHSPESPVRDAMCIETS